MKKRLHRIQIIRMIVQIGFLVLLPGLFSQIFGEMQMIVEALKDGSFQFMDMWPGLLELLLIFPLTLLAGRFFCGWMCAFGTYNDLIYKLTHLRTKKKKRFVNPELDRVLKSIKYILLVGIVTIVWIMGVKIPSEWSPWNAFGMISQLPSVIKAYGVGFILLGIITVGAAFVERFYCRYLCPLGATFGILSKLRFLSLKKPSAQCGNCKTCTSSCAMGLELNKVEKVKDKECIHCMKCVENCPRKNVKVNVFGTKINASIASAAAIIGFIGMYSASGVLADAAQMSSANTGTTNDASTTSSVGNTQSSDTAAGSAVRDAAGTVSAAAKKYKDGTYTGTGVGFRPGTKVSVTIKNSKITGIKVVSTNDDPPFYQRAYNTVIKNIISKQKTSVSSVSGATYSSEGIKSAVDNALSKAKITK